MALSSWFPTHLVCSLLLTGICIYVLLLSLQVFSIVLSFMLYGKAVKALHVVGGAVFLASVIASMMLKTGKKKPDASGNGYAPVSTHDPIADDVDVNPLRSPVSV